MVLPLSCFAGNVVSIDWSQCSIHRCIVDLGVGESKMSYELTPIRIQVYHRRVKPRNGIQKFYTLMFPYLCNIMISVNSYNQISSFGPMLCVMCWFATWGVLCHLTVTKIPKARCGRHSVPLVPWVLTVKAL